jgi:hypothetical protein
MFQDMPCRQQGCRPEQAALCRRRRVLNRGVRRPRPLQMTAASFTNSRGTSVEIWRRMVYTARVAFEVFVFFVIGVCYPKPTLNCNTLASIQLMNGMLM